MGGGEEGLPLEGEIPPEAGGLEAAGPMPELGGEMGADPAAAMGGEDPMAALGGAPPEMGGEMGGEMGAEGGGGEDLQMLMQLLEAEGISIEDLIASMGEQKAAAFRTWHKKASLELVVKTASKKRATVLAGKRAAMAKVVKEIAKSGRRK
jgi:hypothetical protein